MSSHEQSALPHVHVVGVSGIQLRFAGRDNVRLLPGFDDKFVRVF